MTEINTIETFQTNINTLYLSQKPIEVSNEQQEGYFKSLSLKSTTHKTSLSPFFLTALAANYISTPLMHPDLAIDFLRINLFSQEILSHKELKLDAPLFLSCKYTKTTQMGRHEYLHIETFVHADRKREELLMSIKTQFQMRGWGGKPDPILAYDEYQKPKIFIKEVSSQAQVSEKQSQNFAYFTRNQNPMHTSEDIAQNAGFPSIILPFFFNSSFALEHCYAQINLTKSEEETQKVVSFSYQFTRPIVAKDTLNLAAFIEEEETQKEAQQNIHLCLFNQDDTLTLDKGHLSLR